MGVPNANTCTNFEVKSGLSLNVAPNETKSFICGGSSSVHMDVPTQVTGDILPQVPGTADSLQDLPMKYILCIDLGPGGSNPYDLALGGVKLHIPFILPFVQPVKVPL